VNVSRRTDRATAGRTDLGVVDEHEGLHGALDDVVRPQQHQRQRVRRVPGTPTQEGSDHTQWNTAATSKACQSLRMHTAESCDECRCQYPRTHMLARAAMVSRTLNSVSLSSLWICQRIPNDQHQEGLEPISHANMTDPHNLSD
jgi:hypothetical protein